jgi:propanol-preferring alcohol dehydrogenase
MKAMVLNRIHNLTADNMPLESAELPVPVPGPGEVLLRVRACGVCHTELDEIEGRTAPPRFPVIPGHEVVGIVEARGKDAVRHSVGARVGVGWIFSACGVCGYCRSGRENLCRAFKATGRDANGGYAEYMTVPETSAYAVPEYLTDAQAAPLLCAGGVGYRSLRLANIGDDSCLGLTGFGASGHLVLKLARYLHPRLNVYVFARSPEQRDFARELGAAWAGAGEEQPPTPCDAVIDTTPAWKPVVHALSNLNPGGRLVINAIRKEDADKRCLTELRYHTHLWMEKEIKSVANVTRKDITEFLQVAGRAGIKPEVSEYKLEQANEVLLELKRGAVRGAKVLIP